MTHSPTVNRDWPYAYHDPDLPDQAPPLARPVSLVHEGEVIVSIDGENLLDVTDERVLLRGKAGTQVMLRVKSPSGTTREVLATPIKEQDEAKLRYAEWEYSRRIQVEKDSSGKIGYVHLRQAWFYRQPRIGNPVWNMPYAFRGHIVVLCDEQTASDGEAFTEGCQAPQTR